MRDAFAQTYERIVKWRSNPNPVWGQATGLDALDQLVGGLHDEDYTILAGRPSMGKTALAMQIAFNRARAYREEGSPKKVVVFSAEMPSWQVILREAARLARIPSTDIKRGSITEQEQDYLKGILADMDQYPIIIDSTPAIGADAAYAKLKEWKSKHDFGLVVYDHIHLQGGEREYERVGSLSSLLQDAARKLKVPVLALAQLSRKVEDRDPPIPVLSDLRSSGSLEQDADNVFFVNRLHKYELTADQNEAHESDVIVAKARNHGELGVARVEFVPRFVEFRDLQESEEVVL